MYGLAENNRSDSPYSDWLIGSAAYSGGEVDPHREEILDDLRAKDCGGDYQGECDDSTRDECGAVAALPEEEHDQEAEERLHGNREGEKHASARVAPLDEEIERHGQEQQQETVDLR